MRGLWLRIRIVTLQFILDYHRGMMYAEAGKVAEIQRQLRRLKGEPDPIVPKLPAITSETVVFRRHIPYPPQPKKEN